MIDSYFLAATSTDPTPENGQINSPQPNEMYPENYVVSFSCDEGYTLYGPDSATCRGNGRWSPYLDPVCANGNDHLRNYSVFTNVS